MGGRNKALLQISGQTFIARIHQCLGPFFSNTIIISNDINDFGIPNTFVYPDIFKNIGPLGGIHSALVHSFDSTIFVVSCDMPFADPSVAYTLAVEYFKKEPDILVPLINNYKEPLFAFYSKSLIPKIESIITSSEGRPINDLLKITNTQLYELPDNPETRRCFTNINSPDDYKGLIST